MNHKKVADKLNKTLARSKTCQAWKIFERVPNATAIAERLKDIPAHWSLTPLQDKSPRRDNWQTEPFIPHSTIAELILHGEQKVSKKGKTYRAYWSGFGLRTGEASGGLLAIDVDGSSAQPLMDAISGGDIPETPSWSSGKTGRYQLLFQIPDNIREQLKDFNRAVLTEWGDLQTARDENGKPTELLEFRYNKSQSCLPPSRHPSTGAYYWINNPVVPVAQAPDWLCQLLLFFVSQERQRKEVRAVSQQQVEERLRQRLATGEVGSTSLTDVIEQAERRLTPDEAFNWSGHNWKHQGRKEWSGYCPRHQSQSGTAFHINPDTLEWFCHGCNEGGHLPQYRWFVRGGNGTPKGRDFVEIVREIAADAGVSMPESRHEEVEAASFVERERTIDRDQWEVEFGFGKRLRERVKRALVGFKGFGKPPAPKPQPKEAPEQLFQDANQRLQIWQDAVKQGHKYILDVSAPGLGKSHGAGIALPETFGVEKLFYLANDHRNPTTGVIETNYVDLGVRNNGLKIDDSRKTPNGNPFLVWPKPGEEPDTKGNCPKTDLFQKFRAKNLNFEAADDSPICQTCKLAYLCKQGTGGKYGASFRGERRNTLAANRIRAHADSMPSPDDFDYTASGVFWDEVGTQLKPMDSITVALGDFDQVWGEMESKTPDLHEQLKPLRMALRPLLTGEAKQPFHGWDDSGVRALLPEKPSNLDAIITELEEVLQPNLDFLEETPDSISDEEELSKAQQRIVNREFRRQAHEKFNNAFQQLALNWLVPFLKVWNGERGAFRCEWQNLIIFTKSDRHTSVARSAKFNIFLDATIDRERLALLLGIDPEEIYVVGQETPNHGNLKILQITGMGKLGKDRSDSLKDRVAALKKALEEQYPGIVFGDWKAHTDAGDGRWFVNLRGSNEFQAAPALAVFGIPYQNVGHLQALYQTLTGEFAPLDRENPHSGLQRFIEAHVRAEIEQAVGRLRSHLRPNEQLTFMFVGDYDLSFLEMPVEQVEAFQITPSAGTDVQITRWKILEAVRLLHSQSQKLTQVAIATLMGKSQELISKIASEFGGWKRLKKILLVLLNPSSSGSNIFSGLTDDEKWLAQIYLPACLDDQPEDAVEQIGQLVQLYGIKQFLRLLSAATPQSQARLLALLLQSLPFHTELVALLVGGTS
ncbi:MAG TPA: bifunctional DNA primase/polymerase [Stenomitos sp.]